MHEKTNLGSLGTPLGHFSVNIYVLGAIFCYDLSLWFIGLAGNYNSDDLTVGNCEWAKIWCGQIITMFVVKWLHSLISIYM